MKRTEHISLFAAAVIFLSLTMACSKIDRVPDAEQDEIALCPLAPAMSKAVAGAVDDYPHEETMGVFSFYSELGADQSWTSGVSVSSYFENKEFAYREDALLWAGVTPAYWPLSGSLIFAGYSPYKQMGGSPVQNVTFDRSTKTLSIKGYQVEDYVAMTEAQMYDGGAQYKNKCQSDLMYFLPKADYNGDYVGTSKGSAYPADFHHALALVMFNVNAQTSEDIDYIRLRGIVLSDIVSAGNLSVQAGRTQEGTVTWTLSDGAMRKPMQVLYNSSPYGGMKLSIQQRKVVEFLTIPIGEHDIKITYSLIVNGTPHEETVTFKDQWEPGKKYTYNLTLGTDFIDLVPDVDEWTVNE